MAIDVNRFRDALDHALLEVVDGSPYGALFASRVRRQVQAVLHRQRLRGRIDVAHGGREVRVLLFDGPRVETVVVDLSMG